MQVLKNPKTLLHTFASGPYIYYHQTGLYNVAKVKSVDVVIDELLLLKARAKRRAAAILLNAFSTT